MDRLAARREEVLRNKPLILAVIDVVVVTLGSAPIDNIWHIAFGRDAVAWSPPLTASRELRAHEA